MSFQRSIELTYGSSFQDLLFVNEPISPQKGKKIQEKNSAKTTSYCSSSPSSFFGGSKKKKKKRKRKMKFHGFLNITHLVLFVKLLQGK
jgi:hypothetical protein